MAYPKWAFGSGQVGCHEVNFDFPTEWAESDSVSAEAFWVVNSLSRKLVCVGAAVTRNIYCSAVSLCFFFTSFTLAFPSKWVCAGMYGFIFSGARYGSFLDQLMFQCRNAILWNKSIWLQFMCWHNTCANKSQIVLCGQKWMWARVQSFILLSKVDTDIRCNSILWLEIEKSNASEFQNGWQSFGIGLTWRDWRFCDHYRCDLYSW